MVALENLAPSETLAPPAPCIFENSALLWLKAPPFSFYNLAPKVIFPHPFLLAGEGGGALHLEGLIK